MANGIKISQLENGNNITSSDLLPIARGTETFKILANQFVVDGQNLATGAQLFIGKETDAGGLLQFRTLSGTDGISVANVGNTIVVSGSGQNPIKTVFTGTGSQVDFPFPLINTSSRNVNNYRVDIDGVLQEPGQTADYFLNGSNLTFTSAPPLSSKIVVISNNLLPLAESVPASNSITNAMFTDGCINTAELSSGAVTTDKIALSAVTADRISLVTSLSTNGYQIMPGGLIMQWGKIDSINFNQTNQGPYLFPVSFPNNCLNIVTTIIRDTGINGVWNANVNTVTLSSFKVFGDYDVGTGTSPIYWQAIGY